MAPACQVHHVVLGDATPGAGPAEGESVDRSGLSQTRFEMLLWKKEPS